MDENLNNMEQENRSEEVKVSPEGYIPNPNFVKTEEAPKAAAEPAKEVPCSKPETQEPVQNGGKGISVAALVLGIVSVVFCWNPLLGIPCGILGLVFGIIGRNKSKNGMALAGLILGIIGLVISIIILLVLIAAAGAAVAAVSDSLFTGYYN